MTHVHQFTALWGHYGPHGPQDMHLHQCFDPRCVTLLSGPGRSCDGMYGGHWENREVPPAARKAKS